MIGLATFTGFGFAPGDRLRFVMGRWRSGQICRPHVERPYLATVAEVDDECSTVHLVALLPENHAGKSKERSLWIFQPRLLDWQIIGDDRQAGAVQTP